jgi:mannose-6-phosphate isomerase-like protein (cupin superfamily)
VVTSLPGAVGLSHLTVYDWPAEDGLAGGTPHVHLACAEAYVVTSGTGSVQTLTPAGFMETPLEPGTTVSFTPGTLHRLVNADGRLRIVVVMQNSGLPEAGDAVFPFPPELLADPAAYARAAVLPGAEVALQEREQAVRERRDLALAGFARLRDEVTAGRTGALDDFYRRAADLVRPALDHWTDVWREGAAAASAATGDHLDLLRRGDLDHLRHAGVRRPVPAPRLGMCGWLQAYR